MITVEVKIPVLKEVIDFQLDENVPIKTLLEEMTGIMAKRNHANVSVNALDFIMCSDETVMDIHSTLLQNGIREGATLLLL